MKTPSETAIHIAAQCWCDDETSDRVMDDKLCLAFAKRIEIILEDRKILEARLSKARVALEFYARCENLEFTEGVEIVKDPSQPQWKIAYPYIQAAEMGHTAWLALKEIWPDVTASSNKDNKLP